MRNVKKCVFMARVPIVRSENTKFLGLSWDTKLNWISHVHSIKAKCTKDLNLIQSVSSNKWGAEQEILLKNYRALIQSKIDWMCSLCIGQ